MQTKFCILLFFGGEGEGGGGKLEPLFSLSFSLQMINIEVIMEEKGRDAMALLSLMIGLSDCCNGLGCQGQ